MINNRSQLVTSEVRNDVIDILEAGLKDVDPITLMSQVKYRQDFNSIEIHKKTYYLFKGRIFVIGGGKAAAPMAVALEKIVGPENITAGVVNAPQGNRKTKKTKKIKIHIAGHPLPDKRGVKGVEAMLKLKKEYNIGKKDLVICLLSGGGSAMLPAPVDGVSIKDKQVITEQLLKSGASIQEINSVRKHLSRVKGGQLAEHFAPAQVVSFIVSDVSDCDISVIASGVNAPDPTVFLGAWGVLQKFNLLETAPESVRAYLDKGCKGQMKETPKELSNAGNFIIGNPSKALEAMSLKAKQLGYKPIIVASDLRGDPAATAEKIANDIKKRKYSKYDLLLFGGEMTPTLPKKHGQGGRNTHYAAASLKPLSTLKKGWVMASMATDGRDYTPGMAGAIIDNETLAQTEAKGLAVEKYLREYNTYNLFKDLDNCMIESVETGTNVCDVMVYLIK